MTEKKDGRNKTGSKEQGHASFSEKRGVGNSRVTSDLPRPPVRPKDKGK